MTSSQYWKLELKYCERCGGLWLRPKGGEAVYCASCARAINELPPRGGTTPSGTVHAGYIAVATAFSCVFGFAESYGGALA